MSWAEHVAGTGEIINTGKVVFSDHQGKRALETPRRRWKDGIRMILELGHEDMNWVHLAYDGTRKQWWDVVNTVLTFRLHEMLRTSSLAELLFMNLSKRTLLLLYLILDLPVC
jgi:hypothetical protein